MCNFVVFFQNQKKFETRQFQHNLNKIDELWMHFFANLINTNSCIDVLKSAVDTTIEDLVALYVIDEVKPPLVSAII